MDLVPPFANLVLLNMLIISNLCNIDENYFIEHIGTCCGAIYSENEQDEVEIFGYLRAIGDSFPGIRSVFCAIHLI